MAITQHIDLNLIPNSAPVVVHVDQYDHGTGRIIASLYEDSTPYTPSAASVYVQGTKPDGKFFVSSDGVTLEGNVVTADLTEVMTQVAGQVRVQFVVTEQTGRTGTFVFWLDVQASALPDDSQMSESDISMVEEAIETMQGYVSDAAESAQESAASATASSQSAEDSEAWAVGTRNGAPVPPTDPTYHNNSKYWAEHGGGGSGDGHIIMDSEGNDMPQRASLQFLGMTVEDDAAHGITKVTGGAGGSVIKVHTSEASLHGEDVTLSDGTDTLTATFDSNGDVTFGNVMMTGTLTLSSTDGTDTATGTLAVPYYGQYNIDISFWSATIQVSTSTAIFNGLTVSAKKNGVVYGTGTFTNGSATINVPETGTYTLECTYDWKTYQSDPVVVSAETTYPVTFNGFVETVNVVGESAFANKNITISCSGMPTQTKQLDANAELTYLALQEGTYTFAVEYQGTQYSAQQVVTTGGPYTVQLRRWTATVNITTPSSQLYGSTIQIKKSGVNYATTAFDSTGSATYSLHESGTYTFECTYGGQTYSSGDVVVTAETTYNVTINAGLDLSEWITAGSTTEHPLDPTDYADFAALEADEKAVRQLMLVHDAVDYLATASAGDSLMQSVINSNVCAKWINNSDYALDTLSANSDIASEMATADKYGYGEWIVTDSTTTPVTWGAKGNVPIMTSNTAPYGTAVASTEASGASAYIAFNGNKAITINNRWTSTSGANAYIGYKFPTPINIKRFSYIQSEVTSSGMVDDTTHIIWSNDGTNWTTLSQAYSFKASEATTEKTEDVETDVFATYWAVKFTNGNFNAGTPLAMMLYLQFYGRELKALVPIMTADNAPYGVASASTIFNDNISTYGAWRAFDGNDSTCWNAKSGTNQYVQYQFDSQHKAIVSAIRFENPNPPIRGKSYKIQGSNDNFVNDTHDLTEVNTVSNVGGVTWFVNFTKNIGNYQYYRAFVIDTYETYIGVDTLQFYGSDYSEKEFASGSNRLEIYDHGVAPSGAITASSIGTSSNSMTEESDQLLFSISGSSAQAVVLSPSIDMSDYDYLWVRVGNKATSSSANFGHLRLLANVSNFTGQKGQYTFPNPLTDLNPSLDVTQVNESVYIAPCTDNAGSSVTHTIALTEIYVE